MDWIFVVAVPSLNRIWLRPTPWTAAHRLPCPAVLPGVSSLMSTELVMPSCCLILSSLSPPALNLSQHQGLFQWVHSSRQMAKVLELQLQHQPFQWTFRVDFLTESLSHHHPFSCSVLSDSLWSRGLQHSRLPCPSPTPRAFSNSCPLSRWCHPTISSSVVPFSSCLQSFPASGSFPMSQFLASCGLSVGVSASTSVLPMNIQDWFPLGLPSLILQFKGLSRVFPSTTVQKHQFFCTQPSL